MLNIVFVIALFAATSFGSALPRLGGARNGKIRNGIMSSIAQHPWQVSVGRMHEGYYSLWCGGSIISKNWVLTAAHCIRDKNDVSEGINYVFVGVDSNKKRAILYPVDYTKVHQHYKYISKGVKNDIGLVHVSKPFKFNDNTNQILLYRGPSENVHGRPIVVSGFGDKRENISSDHLRAVELDTWNQATCNNLTSNRIFHEPVHQQNLICAKNIGHKAFCDGDSGGPGTIKVGSRTYLVGVVSFASVPCGNGYSIFVDVSYYYDWIENEKRYYKKQRN